MSSWWFEEQPSKVRADAFMRAIFHTLAHVRQIWYLRGLLGLTVNWNYHAPLTCGSGNPAFITFLTEGHGLARVNL